MRNKNNQTFFEFFISLQGYRFENKFGQDVPKYILFWKGYRCDKLKFNRTKMVCIIKE